MSQKMLPQALEECLTLLTFCGVMLFNVTNEIMRVREAAIAQCTVMSKPLTGDGVIQEEKGEIVPQVLDQLGSQMPQPDGSLTPRWPEPCYGLENLWIITAHLQHPGFLQRQDQRLSFNLRRGTSWHFELCEDTMKDCEGFGSTDSDKTRDAKLMSLCMLLSSVFLLNTKGVLSEGLFNALSLVCSLATYVEQGQDTSKPALLWLLRDFLLELVDEKGRRMTPDEYLESSLRKTPRDAVESQRSQAAREVRETLLQSFPDRRCVTLCQPVIDEEQLRQLSEVPFEHLRPEFRRGFQDLQTQLLRLAMSHPKTVQGEAICASAWAAMLRKLVAALNEGTALNVVNAWNQVQHSACNDLSAELQSRVLEEFQKAGRYGEFWRRATPDVQQDLP
ncbi:Guanylate-binding protein 4 (GTP-binding protein 3) (GBP-3) (GTP-binding protein 4) (GBP-4) (Guanine nucleotide-binding protein 4) (Guanylate-binding protein 3) [Durusdinium trenchii]|uniref:Guanylate-binding protein 4 (GTP-binding protein 3) (GBP-3) (GTP-binding protein 4) (GBP-4) (Guanine nucleotide-binding protein 4) (Guanylate-binding protein 3) n=1 Tax=Durusdinium trenchii TaxID=1381693 RepID=A0ABP0JQQ8_9DINO